MRDIYSRDLQHLKLRIWLTSIEVNHLRVPLQGLFWFRMQYVNFRRKRSSEFFWRNRVKFLPFFMQRDIDEHRLWFERMSVDFILILAAFISWFPSRAYSGSACYMSFLGGSGPLTCWMNRVKFYLFLMQRVIDEHWLWFERMIVDFILILAVFSCARSK